MLCLFCGAPEWDSSGGGEFLACRIRRLLGYNCIRTWVNHKEYVGGLFEWMFSMIFRF